MREQLEQLQIPQRLQQLAVVTALLLMASLLAARLQYQHLALLLVISSPLLHQAKMWMIWLRLEITPV